MSPVVGKAMEATLVVLYIGLVTTVLYGGVVPEYRSTAGDQIADRTLADAATDIEATVPPATLHAEAETEVDLPPTIAGTAYRLTVRGDHLVIQHPDPKIDQSVPLVLPDRVVSVSGTWESGDTATVRVETTNDGLEVRLE